MHVYINKNILSFNSEKNILYGRHIWSDISIRKYSVHDALVAEAAARLSALEAASDHRDWDGRSGQLFFMLFRDIYPRVLVRETICLLWYASFPVPRPCNSLAHHLVTGATNGHGLKCDAWGDSKARSPSIYNATCWAKMSPTGPLGPAF